MQFGPNRLIVAELFHPQEILEDAICCDNVMEETFLHRWDRVKSILQSHLNNSADP